MYILLSVSTVSVFMVKRLECLLLYQNLFFLVMMTRVKKCLKWNIKGRWPFFEWPSPGHLLRGWLCISVRAKGKRTFNKTLWDTPLWLATALLVVQNITIYHHDSGAWAESRLRCQENWVFEYVIVCTCVWEALLSQRALDSCDTQRLAHFILQIANEPWSARMAHHRMHLCPLDASHSFANWAVPESSSWALQLWLYKLSITPYN